MAISHSLGFPRIGSKRELKHALESYWKGNISQQQLLKAGREIRKSNWQTQKSAGLYYIPVGDFAWYDQVLNHSLMLGAIPRRFQESSNNTELDTLFRMARGQAPTGKPTAACEMTKWFNTNYHYIVPELIKEQSFKLNSSIFIDEVKEALSQGIKAKPVIIGPLTWLWLGKIKGESFDRLTLLDHLTPIYSQLLSELSELDLEWVQIDEPILSLDLPYTWRQAFESTYNQLRADSLKILLATYYGGLDDNLTTVVNLPVDGIHIDLVEGKNDFATLIDRLPSYKVLSAGVINGRNIWRADLRQILTDLKYAKIRLGERLWVAPSCSLLHVPVDLDNEASIDKELKTWFCFAKQKCHETAILARSIACEETKQDKAFIELSEESQTSRSVSPRIHRKSVKERLNKISSDMACRPSPFQIRKPLQQAKLQLPLLPTTTIGSFPQTLKIRHIRRQLKNGDISVDSYEASIKKEIAASIQLQEKLGLDILVHGEPERNDMVEYFGERLEGFFFTHHGWVQSYGSRCVKPPIIIGDIERKEAMTVQWSQFAQQQTEKPVKGMLTGPVTMLGWSFPREDINHSQSCLQLALALRDEVCDLEKAGISIIQIDEPAIREGLPLRKREWSNYLNWAVNSFKIAAGGVKDTTQIHTHMCYSDFNDIIEYVAALDADVVSIEASRSDMVLLGAFEQFNYPNDIGPGIYDIHSPNIPTPESIIQLIEKASEKIVPNQLWINPDCGLKTRDWPEVEAALKNMVTAARILRTKLLSKKEETVSESVA